ncbi:hypothetical protein J6590_071322 [Homalodisca vitripennis]|nr:hypothetical protein J6590_071322 [Homalodisca vitripennis]
MKRPEMARLQSTEDSVTARTKSEGVVMMIGTGYDRGVTATPSLTPGPRLGPQLGPQLHGCQRPVTVNCNRVREDEQRLLLVVKGEKGRGN